MIIQQWNAATITRHSYTLTYQFLTDLQTIVFFQAVDLAMRRLNEMGVFTVFVILDNLLKVT